MAAPPAPKRKQTKRAAHVHCRGGVAGGWKETPHRLRQEVIAVARRKIVRLVSQAKEKALP